MHRHILTKPLIAIAFLAAFVLAAPGAAQAQAGKLIGTVTEIDAEAGTLSVSESHGPEALTLRFDKKSRFSVRASRKAVKPAEIAPGSAVTVVYEAADDDELPRVRSLQVSPAGPSEEG